jgi:site-specific recombinase XerD
LVTQHPTGVQIAESGDIAPFQALQEFWRQRKQVASQVSREAQGALSPYFVLCSLRHTMLTKLGESGMDAFTVIRIAGHSSIVVSQKYINPTPDGS